MTKSEDIVAAVRLYGTEQGGRQGPTPDSAWNCIMEIDGVNVDARLNLKELGPLSPGQSAVVPICFLDPATARDHCTIGAQFTLRELHTVAEGVIRDVIFGMRPGNVTLTKRVA